MSEQTKISVTLKINKSSVMLYSSQYVKLTGQGGATAQRYLGSFPVTATEVPASFESLLREGTRGRPERYRALMLRIENEVLVPAKIRKEQEELLRPALLPIIRPKPFEVETSMVSRTERGITRT